MKSNTYYQSNSEYLQKNPSWHVEDSPWKAFNIYKLIKKNNLALKSIAEIGCGGGEILNQLKSKMNDDSINFYGYEIAPDAYALCKKYEKAGLEYYMEDMLKKDVFYDLLLVIDVFEHVENYYDFVRQGASKATYKIYHIPLAMHVSAVLRNQPIQARRKVGHLHHFMKDTALSLLEDTGQIILDYFYTKNAIELSHLQKQRTKLMNIPRRILYTLHKDLTVRLLGGYSLLVLCK